MKKRRAKKAWKKLMNGRKCSALEQKAAIRYAAKRVGFLGATAAKLEIALQRLGDALGSMLTPLIRAVIKATEGKEDEK